MYRQYINTMKNLINQKKKKINKMFQCFDDGEAGLGSFKL